MAAGLLRPLPGSTVREVREGEAVCCFSPSRCPRVALAGRVPPLPTSVVVVCHGASLRDGYQPPRTLAPATQVAPQSAGPSAVAVGGLSVPVMVSRAGEVSPPPPRWLQCRRVAPAESVPSVGRWLVRLPGDRLPPGTEVTPSSGRLGGPNTRPCPSAGMPVGMAHRFPPFWPPSPVGGHMPSDPTVFARA